MFLNATLRSQNFLFCFGRLDRLKQTARELSEATGQECLPLQADVRHPAMLREAVDRTISEFGRIDFVICGQFSRCISNSIIGQLVITGAAGNFLASIAAMSENAFKSVMEIDTVRNPFLSPWRSNYLDCFHTRRWGHLIPSRQLFPTFGSLGVLTST